MPDDVVHTTCEIKIIIIPDLYSAMKSEDTEALSPKILCPTPLSFTPSMGVTLLNFQESFADPERISCRSCTEQTAKIS